MSQTGENGRRHRCQGVRMMGRCCGEDYDVSRKKEQGALPALSVFSTECLLLTESEMACFKLSVLQSAKCARRKEERQRETAVDVLARTRQVKMRARAAPARFPCPGLVRRQAPQHLPLLPLYFKFCGEGEAAVRLF